MNTWKLTFNNDAELQAFALGWALGCHSSDKELYVDADTDDATAIITADEEGMRTFLECLDEYRAKSRLQNRLKEKTRGPV